jgi:heptosyltransferase-2
MIDQCAALALPSGAAAPLNLPLPELKVPAGEAAGWRERQGLPDNGQPTVALAPGAVGPSKRWPGAAYADLARQLTQQGASVWVLGGPAEAPLARIIRDAAPGARDFTGTDLRNAILALAAANVAVSNDSGLLHVAAALGTPTIGIFGPTSPWHWAPLNPIAAVVTQTAEKLDCQPCHMPICRVQHHRCMRNIATDHVFAVTQRVLAQTPAD